jgi:hypothetical protein
MTKHPQVALELRILENPSFKEKAFIEGAFWILERLEGVRNTQKLQYGENDHVVRCMDSLLSADWRTAIELQAKHLFRGHSYD